MTGLLLTTLFCWLMFGGATSFACKTLDAYRVYGRVNLAAVFFGFMATVGYLMSAMFLVFGLMQAWRISL